MRMFGRDFVADDRDKKFKMKKGIITRRYRFWYDNYWWGDQKNTPECVGYSWVHWLVNRPILTWLNPTGVYEGAKNYDEWEGTDYDGSSVRGGAKFLHKIGLISSYKWAWDIYNVIYAVLELGPVVVGTNWYEGMSSPKNGLIKVEGKVQGGHAYLITGVNIVKGVFRIKNSWSREWGLNGRAWISFEDMVRLLKEDGEACIGVEHPAKP